MKSRKFNFQCITGLNLKPDTLNLIEENVGNMLELTGKSVLKCLKMLEADLPSDSAIPLLSIFQKA
ncbi:hypothetical protein LEMLEM_LOCUS997, partial [Lemmus lemmus]